MLKNMIDWFFATPTPVVAVLSLLVAVVAYTYQRKWNRKQKAQELAKWYAKCAIPRMRYIFTIFQEVDLISYINKFTDFEQFTSAELCENLDKCNCTETLFLQKLTEITEDVLEKAYAKSGCNDYIHKIHTNLKEALTTDAEMNKLVLNKFITDFLNDLEVVSLEMICNIAEESMLYSSLHQTFLKNVKLCYFFIAIENQFDQNRYYTNIISLYTLWDIKSKKEKKVFVKLVKKRNKTKKI